MRSVVIYALGGGRGHVTRATGLAASLSHEGARVAVMVPEQTAPLGRELLELQPRELQAADPKRHSGEVSFVALPASEPAALRRRLQQELRRLDADHFVVDCFPEGLLEELQAPLLPPERQTVLLRLRRDTTAARFQAALGNYGRRLDLEPHLEWLPSRLQRSDLGGPVVSDFRPRAAEPAVEGAPASVLLVASEPAHQDFLSKLGSRLSQLGVEVELRQRSQRAFGPAQSSELLDLPPLAPGHQKIGIAVAPAGYNLSYELVRDQIWHVALPVARRFDDQTRRARAVAQLCHSPQAVERRVLSLLELAQRPSKPCETQHPTTLARWILARQT